ncbi:MAG: Exodeoxyribonuclease 7 small subunit [Anaerolineales bacterium]|nr:Exodeoxyribonuclease 7 small subunit [Anaerolineales bacterium]
MPKPPAQKNIQDLSYEDALAELETIADSLEEGEQKLEDSLALFERGQLLMKHCAALLEAAELKVSQLTGGELESFEADE